MNHGLVHDGLAFETIMHLENSNLRRVNISAFLAIVNEVFFTHYNDYTKHRLPQNPINNLLSRMQDTGILEECV